MGLLLNNIVWNGINAGAAKRMAAEQAADRQINKGRNLEEISGMLRERNKSTSDETGKNSQAEKKYGLYKSLADSPR